MAWDSMASDEALKDALFEDLIRLAREKAEWFHVPVEWEARWYDSAGNTNWSGWMTGKVLATEEVFHVLDVTGKAGYDPNEGTLYGPVPQYMNRHGQWGPPSTPNRNSKPVVVKKAGWFSREERVFRVSWSDEPPQPGLGDILRRAAELLAPAA